jgi:hypothetical protein
MFLSLSKRGTGVRCTDIYGPEGHGVSRHDSLTWNSDSPSQFNIDSSIFGIHTPQHIGHRPRAPAPEANNHTFTIYKYIFGWRPASHHCGLCPTTNDCQTEQTLNR